MSSYNQSDLGSASTNSPKACPACRSTAVTTSAKHPDANSYWRCERCGEMWNVGRRYDGQRRPAAWR